MKRFLWMGFVLFLSVICSGCGQTFRPIIIPNPPQFPNPAASHSVVSINDNGTIVSGTAMVIDVSGDSQASVWNVGLAPVHAVQQSASEVLVVNHSATGAQADSLTKLNFSGTVIFSSNTISLPANSAPNFVATTESSQAYVLMPNYLDPTTNVVVPSVQVVNTTANNLVATIPVGNNPEAMAETPNAQKLYVANQADNTISGFNTNPVEHSLSPRTVNGSFNGPLWLIARSDSQRLYVLNGNGVVSTIDTTSTLGPDDMVDASVTVPGAAYMLYDGNLNRLYIPAGSQLTILDVSQSIPAVLATIPIPPFTLLNIKNSVPATATAVAALPDGSRAYVASYAVLPSQLNIPSVSGDGTTATYAYTLTAGYPLNPGVTVAVSGTKTGFDGAFIVSAIVSGTAACPGTCFQTPNATKGTWPPPPPGTSGPASGTGSNVFPQVTVVWATSNTIKTTVGIPGFPDATNPTYANGQYYAPVCATTRFRFMMAAGGDSSRAYLSSCDGGNVNFIDTSSDSYILDMPAPIGSRLNNPPQNPVFFFAGP